MFKIQETPTIFVRNTIISLKHLLCLVSTGSALRCHKCFLGKCTIQTCSSGEDTCIAARVVTSLGTSNILVKYLILSYFCQNGHLSTCQKFNILRNKSLPDFFLILYFWTGVLGNVITTKRFVLFTSSVPFVEKKCGTRAQCLKYRKAVCCGSDLCNNVNPWKLQFPENIWGTIIFSWFTIMWFSSQSCIQQHNVQCITLKVMCCRNKIISANTQLCNF